MYLRPLYPRPALYVQAGRFVRLSLEFRRFILLAGDGQLVAAFGLAVLVLTAVPSLYGYVSAPPDKQFMGIVLNVPDTAQYLAWARAFGHRLLIDNVLTPESSEPAFFNLFWFLVGRIGLVLGPAAAVEVARWIAGGLYIGAVYCYIGCVTRSRLERWTAFLVAVLGGGLGWIWVLAKQFTGELLFPLDIYVAETNTLLTVMAFPHQAMAGALLVVALGMSGLAMYSGRLRYAALGSVAGVLLGLQHGYDLAILYAVIGATALTLLVLKGTGYHHFAVAAVVCLPTLPVGLYLLYLGTSSPSWREVLSQYGNAGVFTPSPPHLLVLGGLPLVLALVRGATCVVRPRAVLRHFHRAVPQEVLVLSWAVLGSVLPYLPVSFQIKLLAGWQVPLAVLSTRVLLGLVQRRHRPRLLSVTVAAVLFVLSVLPANLYLYAWRFVDLSRHDYPYYLGRDEVGALRWLGSASGSGEVVLSSLTVGQYVPSVSGLRPMLAHWAQTLDFFEKRELVERFFSDRVSEQEREDILRRFGVRWVFWGRAERMLGDYHPGTSPYLELAFSTGGVWLYRVKDLAMER